MFTSRFIAIALNAAAMLAADTANAGAAPATVAATLIPMPAGGVHENVPLSKIRKVHNVRTSKMEELNSKRLVNSIKNNGFIPGYPLLLERDGHHYNILAGHGRFGALNLLTPEQRKAALADFGGDKVPAIVYTSLTETGRAAIRAHDFTKSSDKMPGDEWSDYLMVKDFLNAGTLDESKKRGRTLSETDIAAFMGWYTSKDAPNRNRVAKFKKLLEMANKVPEVEAAFRNRWDSTLEESERTSVLRDADIGTLHVQLGMDATGTTLREAFNKLVDARVTDSPTATGPHKMTPSDARDKAKLTPSKLTVRLLYSVTGQPLGEGKPVENWLDVAADIAALEGIKHPRPKASEPTTDGNGFDGEALPPTDEERKGTAKRKAKAHAK